jgi:branched-chain amino acid transport system permease protein
MTFELILQYFFSGLTYGSIYAVVAIGFNIIYNSTGIINFAQGEFVMLGGMTASSLSAFMPLGLAIALAVLLAALAGSLVELVFIRSLFRISSLRAKKKPGVLQMIVITIGLSIVFREIALLAWGESVRTLPFFSGSEVSSLAFLGAHFSPQILWVIGTTAFIVAGLTLFFKFTPMGQAMRACAADREGTSLCGINPHRMINLSFTLSAAIGALAGCVVAPLTQTHYDIGAELAIKGFTVATFGGLGNSVAAVLAGLLLGVLESFTITIFPEAFKNVVTIAVLLLVLVFKPSGLFGSKEARVLKEY